MDRSYAHLHGGRFNIFFLFTFRQNSIFVWSNTFHQTNDSVSLFCEWTSLNRRCRCRSWVKCCSSNIISSCIPSIPNFTRNRIFLKDLNQETSELLYQPFNMLPLIIIVVLINLPTPSFWTANLSQNVYCYCYHLFWSTNNQFLHDQARINQSAFNPDSCDNN